MCWLQSKGLTNWVTGAGAHKNRETVVHDAINPNNCTNFPGSLPNRT